MIDNIKLENAKKVMSSYIASGENKVDVYTKVLNTAHDIDLAIILFRDLCENDFATALEVYKNISQEDTKDNLTPTFFNHVSNEKPSKELIKSLMLLGKDFHQKYFEKNKDILSNLLEYDDIIFDTTIDKEQYELYFNYIEKCYELTKKIPYNIEKLKHSDIKTNSSLQEKIKKLEEKQYYENDIDNLFFTAYSTNTLENVIEFFNCPADKIYDKISSKNISEKTKYIAYFLGSKKSRLDKLVEWYSILCKKPLNKEIGVETVVTLYKIRALEIDLGLKNSIKLPKSKINIQNILDNNDLSESQEYDLFYYHSKLINKVYSNAEKFMLLLPELFQNNPFKSVEKKGPKREQKGKKINQSIFYNRIIDFSKNKRVHKFLEREQSVLRSEILILANQIRPGYDFIIRFYFHSIFNYVLSFDDFIAAFPMHSADYFKIFNTYVLGEFRYINNNLYFDTNYGRMKVSINCMEEKLDKIILSKKEIVNLVSYDYQNKSFRITNIIYTTDKAIKKKTTDILLTCFKRDLSNEELEFIKTNEFFIYSQHLDLINYGYLYKKYNDYFKDIKERVIELYKYKINSSNSDTNIEVIFYKYLLNVDKKELLNELIKSIRNILEEFSTRQLTDLTTSQTFDNFRENINKIFDILKELDIEFYNEIIQVIKDNKLESITYLTIEIDNEYFNKLKEEKYSYINEFYKIYPTYNYTYEQIKEVIDRSNSNIKFYIILRALSRNISWYEQLKEDLIESIKEDIPYIDWIQKLELNIYSLNRDTILHPIKKLEYDDTNFTQEEKEFVEKVKKLLDYEAIEVLENSMSEKLNNVRDRVTEQQLESLSKENISVKERIEIAPIILNILKRKSLSAIDKYNILKSLGTNNPFHINSEINIDQLPSIEDSLVIKLNSIFDKLIIEKAIEFYFISPMHYTSHLNIIRKKVSNEQLKKYTKDYFFNGYINIINLTTEAKVYITNILCKNAVECSIDDVKRIGYRIIPFYDKIKFKIKKLEEKIFLEPIIDLSKEEEQLNRSLENQEYFDNLSIKEKENVLKHYCRKDVVAAYFFDKTKIISEDTYIEYAKALSNYTTTGAEFLYLCLIINNEKEFIDKLNSFYKIKEKQNSLLTLQKRILEENKMEYFDTLIRYLADMNLLHKDMILYEIFEVIKENDVFKQNYKSYNENGIIEKRLLTEDIKEYFNTKILEIRRLKMHFGNSAFSYYEEESRKYNVISQKDTIFLYYVIIREIIEAKEISNILYERLLRLNPRIEEKMSNFICDNINQEDSLTIFDIYKEKIISSNDIEDKEYNLNKIVAYSEYLPAVRFKVEELMANNEDLLQININLNTKAVYINKLKEKIQSAFFKYKDKSTYIEYVKPYRLSTLQYVEYLYNYEYIYAKLKLKDQIMALIDTLIDNHTFLKKIIFFDEVYSLASNRQRSILNYNKNYHKDTIINITLNSYNVIKIIKSTWYKKLSNIVKLIEKVLINISSRNEYLSLEEIELIKALYQFEEELYDEENPELKTKIFITTLYENKFLSKHLLFNQLVEKIYHELIPREYYENIEKKSKFNINIYERSKRINDYFEKELYKKTLEELFIYEEEYIVSLFKKHHYQQVYIECLNYLSEYSKFGIKQSFIEIFNSRLLIIEDKQAVEKLYINVLLSFLKNNPKEIIDFIKLTSYLNDYYSLKMDNLNSYMNINNLMEVEELEKEEKIYIYLKTPFHCDIKFDKFLYRLYKNELENTNEITFTNKFILPIDQLKDLLLEKNINISNQYITLTGFYKYPNTLFKMKYEIIENIDVLDMSNDFYKLKQNFSMRKKAYFKLIHDEEIFNKYFDIYNNIDKLIREKQYALLDEYVKDSSILNNIFISPKYDEFRKENLYLNNKKISDFEYSIINSINRGNNFKNELFNIYKHTQSDKKIYLYYLLCFEYGYFEDNIKLEDYPKEIIKDVAEKMVYECKINSKDYKEFFNSLKENSLLSFVGTEDISDASEERVNKVLEEKIYDKDRRNLIKYLSDSAKYIKKHKKTKYNAYDKDIFKIFMEIYLTSKELYEKDMLNCNRLLISLNKISSFNKDVIYEKIIIPKTLNDVEPSKKMQLEEADKFILHNIDYQKSFNYSLRELLTRASEDYQFYIYHVLAYRLNDYVNYKINLSLNQQKEEILIDLIIRLTYEQRNIEEFFEMLKENSILTILDKNEYIKLYNKAIRRMLEEETFEKGRVQKVREIIQLIEENKDLTDKVKLVEDFPINITKWLTEQEKNILYSYYIV